MIILYGPRRDGPLSAVCRVLNQRQEKYLLADQADISLIDVQFNIGTELNGFWAVADEKVGLELISSLYYRGHSSTLIPEVVAAGPASQLWRHAMTLDSLIVTLADILPATVLNRPSAMASNSSKPFQASLIQACGFEIPRTLISTDANAVVEFEKEVGPLIYKSISGVRSIVSTFDSTDAKRLERLQWCPTQFQEKVQGNDWRVHVVGNQVFSSRIESSADDYRYASRSGEKTRVVADKLPTEIENRCVELSKSLGLPFAGVDLRAVKDGRWVCFEVNPSPGFTYYDEDDQIANAVVDMLIK